MSAVKQNFTIYSGDYAKLIITIVDQDSGLKPLDLTGTRLEWSVVKEPHRSEVLKKTSDEGAILIKDALKGIAEVIIKSEDSERLQRGGDYTHTLRVIDSLDQKTTVTTGSVSIE